jgi:hypothetical protein
MGTKYIPERPSLAEQAALKWHNRRHRGSEPWDCWCCCVACRQRNPHYEEAARAALDDIAARIQASMAMPRKKG